MKEIKKHWNNNSNKAIKQHETKEQSRIVLKRARSKKRQEKGMYKRIEGKKPLMMQ